MKTLIMGAILSLSVAGVYAQTDPTTQSATTSGVMPPGNVQQDSTRYWYYPGSNVYLNETTGDYWYFDRPATKWQSAKSLPGNYTLSDSTGRVEVFYKGPDVWRDNNTHRANNKPQKTKIKTKSSS